MAQDLGFAAITRNSMDVSADRDFVLDFVYAASVAMIHLSRLAEDWILYSSEEFGWLELADAVTSGSSLMPQKKNPDSLELIRGKSGRVLGCLTSLMMTMKGLPNDVQSRMQEDKVPLFEAADQLAGSLEMARVVIQSVRLNPAVPAAAAEEAGWWPPTWRRRWPAPATLSPGAPTAGRFVLESVRSGKKPADWTPEDMQRFATGIHRRFRGAARPQARYAVARNPRRHRPSIRSCRAGRRPPAPL